MFDNGKLHLLRHKIKKITKPKINLSESKSIV